MRRETESDPMKNPAGKLLSQNRMANSFAGDAPESPKRPHHNAKTCHGFEIKRINERLGNENTGPNTSL